MRRQPQVDIIEAYPRSGAGSPIVSAINCLHRKAVQDTLHIAQEAWR